jgi:F0F1-type ATP synthase delta subunit
MASNKSSIRYAKALLELAIEKNCVESIEKDLSQFLRTLKDSNDLRIFIG